MRIVFWGTPAYAVPSLDALQRAGHRVAAVVTQPDRRRGRGSQAQPSAVSTRASELGLPVLTPERIRRDPDLQDRIGALQADAHVVVAFGQILPSEVLAQPPLGCWNGHGSLLPRWRGAAPIQWSLLEGDPQTGVGIMAMEAGLDTGPVLLERSLPIGLLDNAEQLGDRLSRLTAELLVEALPRIEAAGHGSPEQRLGRLGVRNQDGAQVTYARLLLKEDFRIDWRRQALGLHRQVMGLYPGAYAQWHDKRLKLLATEPLVHRLADQLSEEARQLLNGSWAGNPGDVLHREPGVGLVVATGGCPLLIRRAQLEGRGPQGGSALIQQLAASGGSQLG